MIDDNNKDVKVYSPSHPGKPEKNLKKYDRSKSEEYNSTIAVGVTYER